MIIPIITIIITFFLTRNLPNQYSSKAQIATGLVDQSQQILNQRVLDQESKINQEFQNLIQIMLTKHILDQVSLKLIIHDFTSKKPFLEPSKLIKTLNPSSRQHAIQVFQEKYKSKQPLYLFNEDQKGLAKVIASMKYDEESLMKNLRIYRLNNSDFIQVEFDSENADLSAYVVNSLCSEFINYYTIILKENQLKAVNFLDSVLGKKEGDLNGKIAQLKGYKIENRVLNLNEQAKQLYEQLGEFETKKQATEQEIISTAGALAGIEAKFNPKERKYLEAVMSNINIEIAKTKDEISIANDGLVRSNFDPVYDRKIDSLKTVLTEQIISSSDKYISSPLVAKESLINQKIQLQINLDLAKNSVNSLKNEITRLNKRFDQLVPHEAVIQGYENSINVASQEYIEILKKFNQTSLDSKLSIRLRQLETAMPGALQPSKKMLLVILAGVISFVFCVIVLFVLFYLDDTIKTAKDLANHARLPVLGQLDLVEGKSLNLASIWQGGNDLHNILKDQLRSLRFEIDQDLSGHKLLVVNSIKRNEGKTFFAVNLAYAFSAAGKSVLLVDGNAANPSISQYAKEKIFLEDYLQNNASVPTPAFNADIVVMSNKGGDESLLELAKEHTVREKLVVLRNTFDIIIVEAPSMINMNKAKEWNVFADKVVTIFQANQTINEKKMDHFKYSQQLGDIFSGLILNKASAPYKKKGIRSALLSKLKK